MSDTLVDSNVLVDILHNDPHWQSWSEKRLADARLIGDLVINPLIYAEICPGYLTPLQVDRALSAAIYRREDLPWEAAFSAARAFHLYRRTKGLKRSPLPDFYIGAHAEFRGYSLLTRDPARYRTYFPTLKIIAPDTNP